MNTPANTKTQSTPQADRKSVHFPSARSLALLRSQVSDDEKTTDVSNCDTIAERECLDECEPRYSLVGNLFSAVTLPFRLPLNFIRTRPWLSGVCVLCVAMVYLVVALPGRDRYDDGLELLDLDVVTRYPDRTNRTLAKARSERKAMDSDRSVSGERTADGTREIDSMLQDNKGPVAEKKSSWQPSPIVLTNPFEERTVPSQTQNGAWLTGKIEIIDGESVPRIVRTEKAQKKHRIVLRPRITRK